MTVRSQPSTPMPRRIGPSSSYGTLMTTCEYRHTAGVVRTLGPLPGRNCAAAVAPAASPAKTCRLVTLLLYGRPFLPRCWRQRLFNHRLPVALRPPLVDIGILQSGDPAQQKKR